MRFYTAALLAIAVTSAFAQSTSDELFKQKIVDAADKYKAGNSIGALSDFMSLYKENPKNADVDSWIGFLHLRNKDAKLAIPFLEQAKALNGKDLEVLNNLGNAYMMAGQNSRAMTTYKELIKLDGRRFQAFYNIGNILLEDKKFGDAEEAFSLALNLQKDSPQVLNNLGVAQEAQNKVNESFASFKRASDSKPGEATYARNAGASAYRLKNYTDTVKYMERAMKVRTQDSKAILALADSYGKLGQNDKMMSLYEKYKDLFDGDFNYFFNLGVMKKEAGKMDEALSAFRSANRLNSKDGETRQNLGVILFQMRSYEDAKSFFQPMAGDGGIASTVKGKRHLAAAASRTGDYRTAMPLWSEVLNMDKNDHEVRLLLADALFNTKDTKAALAMYKEIYAAKPNSASALDGIGRCHLRSANYASAEASFRSAIKADKSFVPAYNNLAVVLEKMNKRSEAIGWLESAARMDENNSDVQRNLKRMRSAG